MIFSYNALHKLEKPLVYLAYPNKKIIGCLKAKNRKSNLCFNNISSFSFTINKYYNGQLSKYYDDITVGKYIRLDLPKHQWHRITDIKEVNNGKNVSIEITAYSLEINLGQTYLTSFGSMGTDDDEQGGLDMYRLYAPNDVNHSILHIFQQANPAWKLKYLDPNITTEYRSFSNDSVASYDFLVKDVSNAFECIFQFDASDYSVSVYKLENIGKQTSIYLSFNNLIKTVDLTWDIDDIKTVFTVSGGSDETGTPLSIADVNPSGNSKISNFTYFYADMSKELQTRLKEYDKAMETNQVEYQNAILQLQKLYTELGDLENKVPDDHDSTDWSLYGLVELEEKKATYDEARALYVNYASSETFISTGTSIEYQNYIKYNNLFNAVCKELDKRENQISQKKSSITNQIKKVKSYIIDIRNFLGDNLYKELSHYVREETFIDDSFIATDIMSQSDIIDMKKSLLEHARKELNKVCFPHFDMKVSSINFPAIFKYKKFTDQLELGNIIYIERDGYVIPARLLQIAFNWDDYTDFSLTFSSKSHLTDNWFAWEEIKNLAQSASTSLGLNSSAWNGAANNTEEFKWYTQQEFLDASIQGIVNSSNQEFTIDNTGLKAKKTNAEGYSPEQLWITNAQIVLSDDSFNSAKIAIGRVELDNKVMYGISAPCIYGRLVWAENLIIENKRQTITMTKDGFIAKASNGFSVTINPDNPNKIFAIAESNKNLLYIDAQKKKLVFKGRAELDEGLISNWIIETNKLYSGNVGLSSSTASGAVSFWAGNVIPTSAPFRVTNQGKVFMSNCEISGGSLNINNNFIVDASGNLTAKRGSININNNFIVDTSGNLTAKNGTFSGTITASTMSGGTIKGTSITGSHIYCKGGAFEADDDAVYIGGFYTFDTRYGSYLSTSDQTTGIGDNDLYCVWTGWDGTENIDSRNPRRILSHYGCVLSPSDMFAQELYLNHSIFQGKTHYWGVAESIEDIYDSIYRLESMIENP